MTLSLTLPRTCVSTFIGGVIRNEGQAKLIVSNGDLHSEPRWLVVRCPGSLYKGIPAKDPKQALRSFVLLFSVEQKVILVSSERYLSCK